VRAIVLIAALAASSVFAQDRIEPVPRQLARVGVEEKLDAALPLQLLFKDDAGRDVTLGSYFRRGHPVLLTLNYYRCPMLCTLELNGLVEAMKGLSWTPGDEFTVVTVSIDPRETPPLRSCQEDLVLGAAGSTRRGGRMALSDGIPCEHRGADESRGFLLRVRQGDRPVRPCRGPGVGDARRTRRALPLRRRVRAGDPQAGASRSVQGKDRLHVGALHLYCYHYDANGALRLAALSIMRIGGALTVLVLGRDRRTSGCASAGTASGIGDGLSLSRSSAQDQVLAATPGSTTAAASTSSSTRHVDLHLLLPSDHRRAPLLRLEVSGTAGASDASFADHNQPLEIPGP
jgi:protein SCO1/2